jgi:hypothetical protein
MISKIAPRIIFYGLIAAIAFAGAAVLMKFAGPLVIEAKPPQAAKTEVSPQCIVTIDNHQYDVANLRTSHTGGDIFKCGTDMSAAFHKQHDDNLPMIQRYLVK